MVASLLLCLRRGKHSTRCVSEIHHVHFCWFASQPLAIFSYLRLLTHHRCRIFRVYLEPLIFSFFSNLISNILFAYLDSSALLQLWNFESIFCFSIPLGHCIYCVYTTTSWLALLCVYSACCLLSLFFFLLLQFRVCIYLKLFSAHSLLFCTYRCCCCVYFFPSYVASLSSVMHFCWLARQTQCFPFNPRIYSFGESLSVGVFSCMPSRTVAHLPRNLPRIRKRFDYFI